MRTIGGDDIARALTYPALVEALEAAFRSEIEVPVRHHHRIAHPRGDATLLLMPAWAEEFLGCKLVTVFPGNAELEKPSVYGAYLLMSGRTGEPLAVIDGRPLTAWRTAAASALAATYLARQDAAHLVMIGAGALAPHLVRAHASVRPIRRVSLWNRTRQRAETLAFPLVWDGFEATVGDDLERLVRDADIVCCATLSTAPLVHGQWLKPGTHVDLVGSFRPDMREADDDVLRRARIFVDTRVALQEAGDLADPIRRGIIGAADIQGDLFDLCRGRVEGRASAEEITLFKSVGTALEDFAAAMLPVSRCRTRGKRPYILGSISPSTAYAPWYSGPEVRAWTRLLLIARSFACMLRRRNRNIPSRSSGCSHEVARHMYPRTRRSIFLLRRDPGFLCSGFVRRRSTSPIELGGR